MKGILTIAILFFSYFYANAQNNRSQFRSGIQFSRLLKHSPNLRINPEGIGGIFDFAVFKTVNGSKDWHHELQFPRYGLLCKYLYLGKPQKILGNAIGLIPFIDLTINKRKSSTSYFMIGSGFAYNNRIYNIVSNSDQNAISTHWNNLTSFEYKYEYSILSKLNIYFGLSMTHISNGAYKAPNLGLNYLSIIAGLSQKNLQRSLTPTDSLKSGTKWMTGINYGYAVKEHEISGGPKFIVQNINFESGYFYRKYKVVKAGFDVEHHSFASYVQAHDFKNENIKDAFYQGLRVHVFAAHEWLFGPLSIETRLGYQIKKRTVWAGVPFYSKLIFQYHIPVTFVQGLQFGLGISLKAQWADAEYMNVLLGLRYNIK
ncbi:MAG: hypothetical protein HOP11_08835 [Saprospiraceae bacterium]|nr:hypothetical protein [Saprospiraceae bacterium]